MKLIVAVVISLLLGLLATVSIAQAVSMAHDRKLRADYDLRLSDEMRERRIGDAVNDGKVEDLLARVKWLEGKLAARQK